MDTLRVWVCQLRARGRAILGSPSTSARVVTLRHGKEKTYDFWNVGITTEDRERSLSHTLVDSVYVFKEKISEFSDGNIPGGAASTFFCPEVLSLPRFIAQM